MCKDLSNPISPTKSVCLVEEIIVKHTKNEERVRRVSKHRKHQHNRWQVKAPNRGILGSVLSSCVPKATISCYNYLIRDSCKRNIRNIQKHSNFTLTK